MSDQGRADGVNIPVYRVGYSFVYRLKNQPASRADEVLDDQCVISEDTLNPGQFFAVSKKTGRTGRGLTRDEAYLALLIKLGEEIKDKVRLSSPKPIGRDMSEYDLFDPELTPFMSFTGDGKAEREVIDKAREILKIPPSKGNHGAQDLISTKVEVDGQGGGNPGSPFNCCGTDAKPEDLIQLESVEHEYATSQ